MERIVLAPSSSVEDQSVQSHSLTSCLPPLESGANDAKPAYFNKLAGPPWTAMSQGREARGAAVLKSI